MIITVVLYLLLLLERAETPRPWPASASDEPSPGLVLGFTPDHPPTQPP